MTWRQWRKLHVCLARLTVRGSRLTVCGSRLGEVGVACSWRWGGVGQSAACGLWHQMGSTVWPLALHIDILDSPVTPPWQQQPLPRGHTTTPVTATRAPRTTGLALLTPDAVRWRRVFSWPRVSVVGRGDLSHTLIHIHHLSLMTFCILTPRMINGAGENDTLREYFQRCEISFPDKSNKVHVTNFFFSNFAIFSIFAIW